jgi:eukaryotic-like serine/threonine-protein kinase
VNTNVPIELLWHNTGMDDLAGIIAIVMSLGLAPAIVWIRSQHKLKERRLELEAQGRLAPPALLTAPNNDKLLHENKLLRERVENLESIVCGVDFELNQKIGKLLDESRTRADAPPRQPTLATGQLPTAANPLDQTAAAAPSSERLEAGHTLANRYRITRLIGRGSMGAVYLAEDQVLSETVALKVIAASTVTFSSTDQASLTARFKREASAARKVSSPNVIRIHDLGEATPGLLYLSMEYFAGRTLAEVMTQRGLLPIAEVLDALGQICNGLEAAHQAGVIHRDLKPANILVGERSAIKIIDFGLATMMSGEGLTMTGAMLGTPNYMAPEQVRGKVVDARTDVYALGALAFHLVCGRPPFVADNAIAVGFAHCSEPPVAPASLRADCPATLSNAIIAALSKAPQDRPASARAFRESL